MMGISNLQTLYVDELQHYTETGQLMPAKNTPKTQPKTEEDVARCAETLDDVDDVFDADVKDADFDTEETQA